MGNRAIQYIFNLEQWLTPLIISGCVFAVAMTGIKMIHANDGERALYKRRVLYIIMAGAVGMAIRYIIPALTSYFK